MTRRLPRPHAIESLHGSLAHPLVFGLVIRDSLDTLTGAPRHQPEGSEYRDKLGTQRRTHRNLERTEHRGSRSFADEEHETLGEMAPVFLLEGGEDRGDVWFQRFANLLPRGVSLFSTSYQRRRNTLGSLDIAVCKTFDTRSLDRR